MTDYTPVYVEGEIITLTTSTVVSGGDVLEVTGSGTVGRCATQASPKMVGVASSDTPIAGRVSFYCRGPVHETLCHNLVTAGDQVIASATPGRVETLPAVVAAAALGATYVDPAASNAVNAAINSAVGQIRAIIGVALTTATDGNKVRWMMYV